MHGDPLLEVSCAMPHDVLLLHQALSSLAVAPACTIQVGNCGTAMRFLTAYCAQLRGCDVVLTGEPRMLHRPIGQLVDALRHLGADIDYLAEPLFPPLHIKGKRLNLPSEPIPLSKLDSTQFASSLILIGVPVQVDEDSPYIRLSRAMVSDYHRAMAQHLPLDWAAAAFFYEYIAIHGGAAHFPGLSLHSLQADRAVVDLFALLGVRTCATNEGVFIERVASATRRVEWSFASCPDLYPAAAITCARLGITLVPSDLQRQALKESNRIYTVDGLCRTPIGLCVPTAHDHRIAMAALAADCPVDDERCVAKSFPLFIKQLCRLRS